MELYSMNLWKIFLAGSPVMWPILFCSIFAMAIILEKFWHLHKIRIDTQQFLNNILDKIKHHQIKEALQICDNTRSPISRILKAGILKYDRTRDHISKLYEEK
ncbi:MAG: hypothetical protein PHP78_01990 [Candidatus Izemoplasmatales bacterium]|nr:hypothetical protein [Candidatus Izemoplasmatales bacterium]